METVYETAKYAYHFNDSMGVGRFLRKADDKLSLWDSDLTTITFISDMSNELLPDTAKKLLDGYFEDTAEELLYS